MRQVVLDTETTGLEISEGHRIIEIGCIELNDRRITGEIFHQYINPGREINNEAFQIHGIDSKFLADKPKFSEIVEDFINFIRDSELIIHNSSFDVGFLEYEFGLANIKPLKMNNYCLVIDTLKMARQLHPGQRNNLDALCKRYKINNKHREWHGALLDAELLAQVYLAMTGGQVSLSLNKESLQGKKIIEFKDNSNKLSYNKTPIIYANNKELDSHNKFMKMIIPE